MAWLSRVNFIASDVLSYTDINNLGNDIRAWGGNVNGGGYTLSNVVFSASSGTVTTINGGTAASSTLTLQSTSGAGTSDAIIFKTASQSEAMRITTGGSVGIGTPSPAVPFHVQTANPSAANEVARFQGGTSASNFRNYITLYSTNPSYWWEFSNQDPAGTGLSNGLAFAENSFGSRNIRAYFASGGNVGIGTASPGTKLDVLASGTVNNTADPFGSAASFVGPSALGGQNANSIVSISSNDAIAANTGGVLAFGGRYSGTAQANWASIVGFKENATSGEFGGFMAFYTRANGGINLERMRISPSGYLLIGYTSSNGAYNLQVNSQIFATNATIATSDRRYKQNVTTLQSGLDLVGKLNPVTFDWKKHDVHNFEEETQVGFIAQEVQEVLANTSYSGAVIKRNELKREDGSVEEFYGMADAKLIPILVKAIQELKTEIDLLKSRN